MLDALREDRVRPGGSSARMVVPAVLLACLLTVPACSDSPLGAPPPRTAVGESLPAGSAPASPDTSDVSTTNVFSSAGETGASTTAAPEPAPAVRTFGVVLTDPSIYDPLNVRDAPGVRGTVIHRLAPTQTGFRPTGRQQTVDGSVWHEVDVSGTVGWVHGYYVTESWTSGEAEDWIWESALSAFADALASGEGLADVVSWRGLHVVHHDDNLRRWRPRALSGLLSDETKLAWASTGASAEERGPAASFAQEIAQSFLADYHDEDAQMEPGGLALGAGAVLPEAAISPAFANFFRVAVHDPGDNPEYDGLDWSTWFVFLDMDGSAPRVVGLQLQSWYP